MLDVAPPEFVAVAAGAGFDAVGLRVAPVTRDEEPWPVSPGSDGAGLLLDTLHIKRCGVSAAELAAVDPALLGYLQLCDAPARPPGGDATVEARTGRLLPGEGELPLAGLLGALPDGLPVS